MLNIVIEGLDNSGKSTLAAYLKRVLRMPIQPGEGPEKYPGEINDRVRRYLAIDQPTIFDRHPCVSQSIHAPYRNGELVDPYLLTEFYETKQTFIFCVDRGLDGHNVKSYDTQFHQDMIAENYEDIREDYLQWALRHAHIIYRVGDSLASLADRIRAPWSFDPVEDISEFHDRFSLTYDGSPRMLPDDLSEFRRKFMEEELGEYRKHSYAASLRVTQEPVDQADINFHKAEMLDALVDLVYVALGTSYLHGFDFREAWYRVHEANMKKVRAERVSDSKRGSTFDVVKPEGWEPPYLNDLVE